MASSGSSKKLVPKYIKFIMLQKLSECKRSVNFLRGEVRHAIMNIDHLNGLIEMMEVMEFTLEIYDTGGNTSRKGKEIRYELPECTPTKDDTLRCSSSTPISSKLKRNSSKKIKEGLRKKGKAVGRTLIDSCDKGKEKVDEFPAATPTKEHQVVVTNYKRAIVNGKAKMVEVVAPVQENVDVGIKQEDRRRKNVLGSMAPANFVKNPVVSASMGQGSSVKVC
ncbi:hypothetical protein Tco_1183823 [Tanacetum coccineum]